MRGGGRRRVAIGAAATLLGLLAWTLRPRPEVLRAPPAAPPARHRATPEPLPPPVKPAEPPRIPEAPETAVPAGTADDRPHGDLAFRVVAAESGEPLDGVKVEERTWEGGDAPLGEVLLPGKGDPPGRIRIRGCAAIRQGVTVSAPGRGRGKVTIVVVAGQETVAPDLALEREARIRCRVLDDAGRPKAGVVLHVSEGFMRSPLGEATTGEDGTAVLDGLPGGLLLISDNKGHRDQLCFARATAGELAEVVLGGRPQLEVFVHGDKRPRNLILVPLDAAFDPLLGRAEDMEWIPPGTLLVSLPEDAEDEKTGAKPGSPWRFSVGGLRPGKWFVIPEDLPLPAVVDLPAASPEPTRLDLKGATLRLLLRNGGTTGTRGGSLVWPLVVHEEHVEPAFAGDATALLELLILVMDQRSVDIQKTAQEAEIPCAGDGPVLLLLGNGAFQAAPLRIAAPGDREDAPVTVDLHPGNRVTVRNGPGKEGPDAAGEGEARQRWKKETHLAAARDAEGRLWALWMDQGDVSLQLPAGRWTIEVRGPRGLHRKGIVEVTEGLPAEFLVD